MHITVILGLSVLLVFSLTVNGFAVQEENAEDDEMMLESRDIVDQFDDAEAIFFVSETLRELEDEDVDEEEMTLRAASKGPTQAQINQIKAACKKNTSKCNKAKQACQKNKAQCQAKAKQACSKSKNKPAACSKVSG